MGGATPTDTLMRIEVLLFAAARDAAGRDSIWIDVPGDATAGDVLEVIGDRLPEISRLLPSCRLAVDCGYVEPGSTVPAAGEIALIPPVSGG